GSGRRGRSDRDHHKGRPLRLRPLSGPARAAPAGLHTVLVSMPFMDIGRPSIQLGLLKAIGEQHGFPVRTLHANLDFAARIGADYYRALAEARGPLVGDWLFSVAAFGAEAPDPDGRLLDECAGE